MLLHWACLWPQGLRLLLERDYCTHYLEGCGLSALDWAIGYGEHRKVFSNAEAVDILLQASVPITSHTWALALGSGDQGTQEKIARAIGEEGYPKYGDSQRILTHYHSHHLSVRSAQALFDAGLKDVDVDVAYPLPDHEKQTPLYSASMIFREYPNFNWGEGVLERLRLCQWFVSKGARVDAPHLFALTPAHLIANRLLEAGIALANVRKWEECHPLMNQVFQCRARDSCRCACGNEEGCWVFTPALSDTKYGWAHKTSHKREALEVLLFFDPRIAAHHECCMAICRALTFGELRLTHTCHPHSQYWRHERPPTEEDISEIRNIEEHELAVLEALLEEFEIAWKAFDGTLIEFIDGPWSQRMKMVNNELNDPRPGELQEIQNLGVILTSFGPEEPVEGVPRDSKLIAGSWDWFQRGTEDIMERRDYYWVWQCPWP